MRKTEKRGKVLPGSETEEREELIDLQRVKSYLQWEKQMLLEEISMYNTTDYNTACYACLHTSF